MSEKRLVYLIGEPGAGKTTLMRHIVAPFTLAVQKAKPFTHIVYEDAPEPAAQLGKDRGDFSGTDGLGLSAQPGVMDWVMRGVPFTVLLAEGDRLANDTFFTFMKEQGWDVRLVLVRSNDAAARRAARGPQDEAWVLGRQTKVLRLAEKWHPWAILDTNGPEWAAVIRKDVIGW